jgi:adenosylcobinamide-GDP ribazoletransferase
LAFLTPIPVTRGDDVRPLDAAALPWFPVVGASIGLAVGATWWVAGEWWPPLVAGAIAVVADLALTGLLHVDGLVDAADGLLPPLADRERRLDVMADPSAGAFGVTVLVAALLVRVAALSSHPPNAIATAALWSMSRTCMAITARHVPYARPTGLAAGLARRDAAPVAPPVDVLLALAAVGAVVVGGWAALAVAAGAAAVVRLSVRRLGGFTGDVLGAAGVLGETLGLVVLAATW